MAARLWQGQESRRDAFELNPAQCTATISSCQRFAGVQVPAEHSYGSFYGAACKKASVLHAARCVFAKTAYQLAFRTPETTYAAHLTNY